MCLTLRHHFLPYGQGDSHDVQESRARQRKQHADAQCDDGRLAGHYFLEACARALREAGEQGDQRDGIDHDEKDDEEFDELFDHCDVAARKIYILREGLIGS